MHTGDIISANDAHIVNTYGPRKLALVKGQGARVWDADGVEYLDFFAGIAVANLGHCHPRVTEAVCRQAGTLVHVSNLFYIEPQVQLATRLSALSFADRWFFANCGATANEAAIKLARRYWAQKGTPKPHLIAAEQSFHGRTMATLSATGQPKYHDGFAPMLPGCHHVPYNDIDALRKAITPEVGAILLEPIQGEGGVRVPDDGYLPKVRALCDEHGILLIFDEVQVGMGRTGKLFAHEHSGVTPDIMTLAKALANGVPIGAMGCTEDAATGFSVGSHATTFGGNPLCCAAALATLEVMAEPGFLDHVNAVSAHFFAGLHALAERSERITEVRGRGLMIGVEMAGPAGPVVDALRNERILCGVAGPNVLRFVPPLIITMDDVDRVLDALGRALGDV